MSEKGALLLLPLLLLLLLLLRLLLVGAIRLRHAPAPPANFGG
jgi:hypothetical protein